MQFPAMPFRAFSKVSFTSAQGREFGVGTEVVAFEGLRSPFNASPRAFICEVRAVDGEIAEIAAENLECDPFTDWHVLRRIIGEVVPVEHAEDGMLSLRFQDGTRLSFLCGPTGRLNVVVVQHGPDTPEIRLPVAPEFPRRDALARGELTPGDCQVPVPTTIMRMLTLPEIERGWVDPGSGVGSPKAFTLLRRSGPDVRDGEIVRSPVAIVGWVEPDGDGIVAFSMTGGRVFFPSWDEAMAYVEADHA